MLFVLDYEGINHRGTGQLFFFFPKYSGQWNIYMCTYWKLFDDGDNDDAFCVPKYT